MTTKSDWVLTAMLALAAVIVVRLMWPVTVDPVLRLDIAKNRSAISDLHQTRDIEASKTVMVDMLDLARDARFAHARLGAIGYDQNFFVDIARKFTVLTDGSYRFVVASDDGFSLQVDGRQLCAFTHDRALTTQTCTVLLTQGEHEFKLSYFQAGGPAGLSVQYGKYNEPTLYWFGQDSQYAKFPR